MNDALISRFAQLQTQVLSARFPDADRNATYYKLLEQARAWRTAIVCEHHASVGVIVVTEKMPTQWGEDEAWLHIVGDESEDAEAWIRETIARLSAELPASLCCRVPVERAEWLPLLREHGFGFSKLGLGGHVDQMMARLRAVDLAAPKELSIHLVETIEHIRASSALRRDYFVSHPEHGWSSRALTPQEQEAIDQRVESQMTARFEALNGVDWVVVRDGEVVGCFGLNLPPKSPVVGVNAGLNICLDPSIQRLGVGTLAYRLMVSRASELGIEYLHGSTSNPGVIRIARKIGRHLDNWLLRRDRPWITDDLADPF